MANKKAVAAAMQPKFKLSVLKENCVRLFGCSTATFAGATYDLDNSADYTVDEVRNVIADWNKKEVM